MKYKTTHSENLVALRRIEGQVRGIQRMIEEKEYCVDIVTQLHAAISALYSVSDGILAKHIEGCVVDAFKGNSRKEKFKKIEEVKGLIRKLHKL